MSKSKKERIQLYAVSALSLVLAVMAYFRFFRKPVNPIAAGHQGTEVAVVECEIPALPAWLASSASVTTIGPASYKPLERDLFAPHYPPPKPKRESNPDDRVAALPGRLRLSAVMEGAKASIAAINGQLLRAGDKIEGYTVSAIHPRQVILKNGHDRLTLIIGE